VTALAVTARAKINLGLEILGRRPDGFHSLVTILQEIDLADRIVLDDAPDFSLTSNHDGLGPDSENLVWRAVQALREATGITRGARVHLDKRIPVAAGLGGGSSDAAATLLGLNRLWNLGLGADVLMALARGIGTDVAFFVRGGTQLATGLGDDLESLPSPRIFVVVVPLESPYPDKTRRLYAALRATDWSDGRAVQAIAEALRRGESLDGRNVPNSFDRVAKELNPSLCGTCELVRRAGGTPFLSGAGPTVISVHRSEREARSVAAGIAASGQTAIVARTIERSGQPAEP